MKAGRELDALVATKVMWWIYDKETDAFHDGYIGIRVDEFKPSERIADAWIVVEKLGIAIIPQSETAPKEYKYLAKYYDKRPWENPGIEAFAETAPLAICLCALKALGVGVGVEAE